MSYLFLLSRWRVDPFRPLPWYSPCEEKTKLKGGCIGKEKDERKNLKEKSTIDVGSTLDNDRLMYRVMNKDGTQNNL